MISTSGNNDSQAAIAVNRLSKTYRDGLIFRKRFPALREVSFEVRQGEVFGLLGPNGAGKTTFLKIMLGIIRKSGGGASMLGYAAGSRRGRRLVGYLPEQLRIPRHLTGYTALDYYGRLNGLSASRIRRKRDGLLEFVGLSGRGGDRTTRYSKGMLQRLGLAQALLHDPQLLVLDEPTDGLDPGARAEMRQLMRDLRERGVTIFLNSHLLQEVEMVCDRVAILDRGHLRYCGAVADIDSFINQSDDSRLTVQLEVTGPADTAERLLVDGSPPDAAVELVQAEASQSRVTMIVRLRDQAALDAAIDRLRQAGISLIRIDRPATSLEDAFLQIVGDRPSGSADVAEGG